MLRILLSSSILLFSFSATAQSVAINTDGTVANSSALLDVKSIEKGVLIPRMSKAQKNAISSPAIGLLVFQNNPDSIGFHYHDGANWIWLAGTANADTIAWKITGNGGTNVANHFLGTTDNIPLSFRQNNNWIGRLNSSTNNYTLGFNAGRSTTGTTVIAIGDSAQANGIAGQSIVIGSKAAKNNNSGGSIVIGYEAAYNNTTPGVAIGYQSQRGQGSALNTSLGSFTLAVGSTGGANTAIGYNSMNANRTGSDNTALGRSSLTNNRSGSLNTAVGSNALSNDTSSHSNTAIGAFSLSSSRNSFDNTAVGYGSLLSDSTGNGNVALGYRAAYFNKTGSNTIAIGKDALFNSTNRSNLVAIGTNALRDNSISATFPGIEAINNIGIGHNVLTANRRGSHNVVIGTNALSVDTLSRFNTAIGSGAMQLSNNSSHNTAMGSSALSSNITGGGNVAIGANSMLLHRNQPGNTAVGFAALQDDTTGSFNTAIGYAALGNNNNGTNNTAIGNNALTGNITGFNNTALGTVANVMDGLQNANAIGTYAYVTQNNSMVLGSINGINLGTADTKVGINTTAPDSLFSVANNFMVNKKGEIQYSNPSKNMIYMFQSGFTNPDRMIVAHSPSFPDYGIQFQDISDKVNFLSGGTPVMTVDLLNNSVGVGTSVPNSTFHANGTVAVGVGIGVIGGSIGSPALLTTTKVYLGLSPAAGADHYLLPNPATCTGRIYYMRNNDNFISSFVGTSAGLICPGSSNCLASGSFYELKNSTSVKTIIAISDGISWIIGKID